jgi:type 1 glutamine amidotransferase
MSKKIHIRLLVMTWMIATSSTGLLAQKTPDEVRVVTEAEKAAIAAAMPAALPAKANVPRTILVISHSQGYYHRATPLAETLFKFVADKYPSYSFIFSSNQEDFRAEKLKQVAAIVCNNNTGIHEIIKDPEIRKAIITFVEQGGGFMAVHGAADGGWLEYNQMVGCRFAGHPWGSGEEHPFINEQPTHPLSQAFGPGTFRTKDEIYVSDMDSFDREKFKVLVSMDLSDTITAFKPEGKAARKDRDYSVVHLGSFGKGRTFYTSFGHADTIFTDKRMILHYLSGLQYVAGDLTADATPVPLYDRIRTHAGPLYYEARLKLANMARLAETPQQKAEVSALCTRLIQDKLATAEGRQAAIEALSYVFTPTALQALTDALADAAVSHAALVCLSRHADDKTFKQLCVRVAGNLPEAQLINLINAMGARGDSCADLLQAFALKGSTAVRLAAIQALGPCATEEQIPHLKSISEQALVAACEASVLQIAARLPALKAFQVCDALQKTGHSTPIKQAALIGAVQSTPSRGEAIISDALANEDANIRKAAVHASMKVPGDKMAQLLADRIMRATPGEAIVLVEALANRQEAQVPILLEKLLARADIAGDVIEALRVAGTAQQIPALVSLLASPDKNLVDAASFTLSEIRAAHIDAALATELEKAPANTQASLLKVCATRQTAVLAPATLKWIASSDQEVVSAALKAVAVCGAQPEFTALCDFALAHPDNGSVLSALTKLGLRLRKTDAIAKEVITYAERAQPEQRLVFLQLLGRFQNQTGADYLPTQLFTGSPERELAVIRVLASWESSAPAAALLAVCKQGRTEKNRDMAFIGCSKLMANDPELAVEKKMEALTSMMTLAQNDRQRIAALNGLASIAHPNVETLARPYLTSANKELYTAAKNAISQSDRALRRNTWQLSSNMNNKPDDLKRMVDMDPATRWTSGAYMHKSEDMWVMVDLGSQQKICTVTLDTLASAGDYPRKYALYVSDSPTEFGKPVASGAGAKMTAITCEATGRFVKIVQCGKEGPFWSIHELKINGLPAQREAGARIDPASYTLKASFNAGDLTAVSDGNINTGWSMARQKKGQNIVVDLKTARPVSTLIFARKNPNDAYPGKLHIYCSNDPANWDEPIAVLEGTKQETRTSAGIYPFAERYLKIEVEEDAQHPWELNELELKE